MKGFFRHKNRKNAKQSEENEANVLSTNPFYNGERSEKEFEPLINIQAKMAEGRGPGFENWAKKHNLKQIAKTVLYLQQHDLMDFRVLAEKAALAAENRDRLSKEIKAAEQRMKEISLLEKHIVNYVKTKDTYAAYRKAGYSKAFRAEHEEAIRLCKEAKAFFDASGLQKLPTIKSLKAEYAALLEKKKALYPEYKKAREEAEKLQVANANVDAFLHDKSHTVEAFLENRTRSFND
ncbi:MAG: hypothetical protein IKS21_03765 [Oscillospiraceae bacterium]|nr:hypothetical protein [Oscillospiraceae bacterium]